MKVILYKLLSIVNHGVGIHCYMQIVIIPLILYAIFQLAKHYLRFCKTLYTVQANHGSPASLKFLNIEKVTTPLEVETFLKNSYAERPIEFICWTHLSLHVSMKN